VSQPELHDLWVLTLGIQHGGVGVPEVVETKRLTHRAAHGGEPGTSPEVGRDEYRFVDAVEAPILCEVLHFFTNMRLSDMVNTHIAGGNSSTSWARKHEKLLGPAETASGETASPFE
jgi:hypothetical protein